MPSSASAESDYCAAIEERDSSCRLLDPVNPRGNGFVPFDRRTRALPGAPSILQTGGKRKLRPVTATREECLSGPENPVNPAQAACVPIASFSGERYQDGGRIHGAPGTDGGWSAIRSMSCRKQELRTQRQIRYLQRSERRRVLVWIWRLETCSRVSSAETRSLQGAAADTVGRRRGQAALQQ